MTDAQNQKRQRLLQHMARYYKTYYAEQRRLLSAQPAYKSDPESFPYHLRDYDRIISIVECSDGYTVQHYADPDNRYGTDKPESFELVESAGSQTVKQFTRLTDLPEHNDYMDSDVPILQKKETGEYIQSTNYLERTDAIGMGHVPQMTPERARTDAQKELQDFFNQPESPFFT